MNTAKNTIRLTVCVMAVIVLGGCFSHWQGDTAKIVISIGGAERAVDYKTDDTKTHNKLKHDITLTGATEKTLDLHFTGTTFEADVAPGDWNIRVDSWLGKEIYATGSKDVVVKSGQNYETIEMYPAYLVTFNINGGEGAVQKPIVVKAKDHITLPSGSGLSKKDYVFGGWNTNDKGTGNNYTASGTYTPSDNITLYAKWDFISDVPGSGLAAKLNWLSSNAVDGGSYTVTVDNDEDLAPRTLSYGKKVTITLKGNTQKRTVSLSGNGSLFTVESNVTLILDSVTLQGHASNNASLVKINSGGTLEMNAGAKITGNNTTANKDECGGGVFVFNGGTFTMNDGEIFQNKVYSAGGGVYVLGIFNMNGGNIYENTANYNGGGVYVDAGLFTKTANDTGGTIYDNNIGPNGTGIAVYAKDVDDNFQKRDSNVESNEELSFDGTKTGGDVTGVWDQ